MRSKSKSRWTVAGKWCTNVTVRTCGWTLEEDIDIEYGNIRLYRREGEKKGIKLDEYLIPVFRWDDIEEEAERIIQ